MTITAYSKPHCPQCDATYRILNKQDIDHHSIDMTEDVDALEYIKSPDYRQALVVVIDDSYWSDFRPDRIKTAVAVHLDSASLVISQT